MSCFISCRKRIGRQKRKAYVSVERCVATVITARLHGSGNAKFPSIIKQRLHAWPVSRAMACLMLFDASYPCVSVSSSSSRRRRRLALMGLVRFADEKACADRIVILQPFGPIRATPSRGRLLGDGPPWQLYGCVMSSWEIAHAAIHQSVQPVTSAATNNMVRTTAQMS